MNEFLSATTTPTLEAPGAYAPADQVPLLGRLLLTLEVLRNACCHRLVRSVDVPEKIGLSERVHRVQLAYARARERFDELTVPHVPVTFPAEDLVALARECIARDFAPGDLDALVADAREQTRVLLARVSRCADGPTEFAVQACVAQLECVRPMVRRDAIAGGAAKRTTGTDASARALAEWSGRVPWPEFPEHSGRDANIRVVSPTEWRRDFEARAFDAAVEGTNVDVRATLHGKLFNIEVSAAEVCAMMLARFQGLPAGLQEALTRQCWDEGRHAELCLNELTARGGALGDHPIHTAVWQMVRGGESIAECLCLEQVIGEGFALGNDVERRNEFREKGDQRLAQLYEWIYLDEIHHVRKGLSWFRVQAGDEAQAIFEKSRSKFVGGFNVKLEPSVLEFVGFRDGRAV